MRERASSGKVTWALCILVKVSVTQVFFFFLTPQGNSLLSSLSRIQESRKRRFPETPKPATWRGGAGWAHRKAVKGSLHLESSDLVPRIHQPRGQEAGTRAWGGDRQCVTDSVELWFGERQGRSEFPPHHATAWLAPISECLGPSLAHPTVLPSLVLGG